MLRITKLLYKLAKSVKPKTKKIQVNDLIRNKKIDVAVKNFESKPYSTQIDTFSYSTIIKEYLNKGELIKALNTLSIAQKKRENFPIEIYNTMIEKFMDKKDQNKAEEVYGILYNSGLEPNDQTYFALLLGYIKCEETQKAFTILEKIHQFKFSYTQKVFEELVRFYLQLKDYNQMMNLIEESASLNVPKTSTIYQCLFEYYFQKKEIKKACQVVEDMHSQHLPPINSIYFSIIDHYVNQENNIGEAKKWLNKMKRRGLKKDILNVYDIFIKNFLKESKFNTVENFLNLMIEDGLKPNVSYYNQLLNVYMNNHTKFDQLIETMENNKIQINEQTKSLLEKMNKL